MRKVSPHALTLTSIAIVVSCVLVSIRFTTSDRVLINQQLHQQRLLAQLLPIDELDNEPFANPLQIIDPQRGSVTAYPAIRNDTTYAIVLATQTEDGYNGRIELMVAINADLTIAGARVTHHLETPGLGDDIDHSKSDWIDHFHGKSLVDPIADDWAVRKDGGQFDQFTGATITPRAVVEAIKQALILARLHYTVLFNSVDKQQHGD